MATHQTSQRRHLPEKQRTTISAHTVPRRCKAPRARSHPHRHADCPSHRTPRGRHPADGDTDDNTQTNNTIQPLAHPASRPSLVNRRLKCSFSSTSDQVTERRPPRNELKCSCKHTRMLQATTTRARSAAHHRSTKLRQSQNTRVATRTHTHNSYWTIIFDIDR